MNACREAGDGCGRRGIDLESGDSPSRGADRAAAPNPTIEGDARSAMLCGDCQAIARELTGRSAPERRSVASTGLEPLRALLCEQCLTLLPAADSTDLLLRTLSQLARFGLGAQTRPLLTAAKGER